MTVTTIFVAQGVPHPAGARELRPATARDGSLSGAIVEADLAQVEPLVGTGAARLEIVATGDAEHRLALVPAAPESWDHSSLAVSDLDSAIEFYRQLLGFEIAFVERGMSDQIAGITGLEGIDCDLAQLRSPSSRHTLELIAFRGVPLDRGHHAPTEPGRGHVGFRVEDLDAALALVERLGGHRLGDITYFEEGRSAYCRDPNGSYLELSETG